MFVDLTTIDGVPVQVPEGLVSGYLRLGYRPIVPEKTAPTQIAKADGETVWIDVNNATATDLRSLPLVGVGIAKKVIANRPYQDIADLIQKVEGVDWLSLQSQLAFGDVDA